MSSVARREDEEAAEAVREWIARQTFGALRPVAVDVSRDEDSTGEPAWFFDVTLPDPNPGEGTWPLDDLVSLDLATRDEAIRRGLPWPWHVRLHPVTDEPQADEDELDAEAG